jgi:hypothetical protein
MVATGALNPHACAKRLGLAAAQPMQIADAADCHGRTGTAWRRHTVLRPSRVTICQQ